MTDENLTDRVPNTTAVMLAALLTGSFDAVKVAYATLKPHDFDQIADAMERSIKSDVDASSRDVYETTQMVRMLRVVARFKSDFIATEKGRSFDSKIDASGASIPCGDPACAACCRRKAAH